MFQTEVVDEIKTPILYSITFFFSKIVAFFEILLKTLVETERPQMWIRRMHFACWIPNSTNTHVKFVILTAFPVHQWLHERPPVLSYTQSRPLLYCL